MTRQSKQPGSERCTEEHLINDRLTFCVNYSEESQRFRMFDHTLPARMTVTVERNELLPNQSLGRDLSR